MAQLPLSHQQSLVDFAGYLVSQYQPEPEDSPILEPGVVERPSDETVVAAIKRLKLTYHMLDTDSLLNKVSDLMGQHLLQGREASQVIDELQTLFEASYQEYRKK